MKICASGKDDTVLVSGLICIFFLVRGKIMLFTLKNKIKRALSDEKGNTNEKDGVSKVGLLSSKTSNINLSETTLMNFCVICLLYEAGRPPCQG